MTKVKKNSLKEKKVCSVEGCENKHNAKGYCQTHYVRFRKHGDPLYEVPIINGICNVGGCEKKAKACGYCCGHYKRFKRYGDPLASYYPSIESYLGERFGTKTIISVFKKNNGRHNASYAEYECVCGDKNNARISRLKSGELDKCGCKHGLTGKRVYNIWNGMIARCGNPKIESFKYYGAKGVKVCDRWKSIRNFFSDMGHPPQGHSLDRIDPYGDYCPENCRWADQATQARNKRISPKNTTGVSGVYKSLKKFRASISVNNKNIHLGSFENVEDAITARKEAELKYWK